MTSSQSKPFTPKITVFYCLNSQAAPALESLAAPEVKVVSMPCSCMIREVFLLRALEAGADAVALLVCPEGQCHNVNGNTRAAKRVARMKKLVDEIGLDGRRLSIHNITAGDAPAVKRAIEFAAGEATGLGPNPAA